MLAGSNPLSPNMLTPAERRADRRADGRDGRILHDGIEQGLLALGHRRILHVGGPVGAAGVIRVGSSRNYGEHGSYLPDRRWRADLA